MKNKTPHMNHSVNYSVARRLRQAGFSMVELMVAVTIGLFITLGLSQIFVNMYSSSSSQKSLAQYQDNIRNAMVILTNQVEIAGYFSTATTNTVATALPAYSNTDGSTFTAGSGIVGTGAGAGSDTINIYYQSGGFNVDQIINCQGGTAATSTNTTFVNSFSVNGSQQLICKVGTAGAAAGTALVLATGVQSMNILYGVASSGATSTGSYLTATQVAAAGAWANVRCAQITLVFSIPSTVSTATTTQTWTQTINLMRQS